MLVLTQSGEALAEVVHVYLSEMVGSSDYYIFGTCAGHGMFSGSKLTLGVYKSKEEAKNQLSEMTGFFAEKPSGVYKMK